MANELDLEYVSSKESVKVSGTYRGRKISSSDLEMKMTFSEGAFVHDAHQSVCSGCRVIQRYINMQEVTA
ncbi:MAG: hypothetical protein ABIH76_03830, partial [Candidatus Bathyarchaeota archaeon]